MLLGVKTDPPTPRLTPTAPPSGVQTGEIAATAVEEDVLRAGVGAKSGDTGKSELVVSVAGTRRPKALFPLFPIATLDDAIPPPPTTVIGTAGAEPVAAAGMKELSQLRTFVL